MMRCVTRTSRGGAVSPNDKYAALVAAAGYLPLTLTGEDYLELLPMVAAPFADFTWRHARRLAAQAGRDDTNETEVARVLDELLTRAHSGPPVEKADARVAARTRVAAASHRPPPRLSAAEPEDEEEVDELETTSVVPLGIFDARAEAERWPY
jgi:putative transposase